MWSQVVMLAVGVAGSSFVDDELRFAAALAGGGYFDLAERQLAGLTGDDSVDPIDRVEVLIDGLAGVRMMRALAVRDEAALDVTEGGLDRTRAAFRSVHEAVERGWRLADEIVVPSEAEADELRELFRFGLCRHAEASLELALAEPLGSLSRGLLADAARDGAVEYLWGAGDRAPWSSAAYLVHGRACLDLARAAGADATTLEEEGLSSLRAVSGLVNEDVPPSGRRRVVGYARRAMTEQLRALRHAAARDAERAPSIRSAALQQARLFRARALQLVDDFAPRRDRFDLEVARLLSALGEPARAEQLAEQILTESTDPLLLAETRRMLDR